MYITTKISEFCSFISNPPSNQRNNVVNVIELSLCMVAILALAMTAHHPESNDFTAVCSTVDPDTASKITSISQNLLI